MDDQPERVVFYVRNIHFIGSFENLQDIFVVDVVLEVVLAKCLQPVVGEAVEARRLEQVKRVLGRHFRLAIVNVPQQRVERLQTWFDVADLDVHGVVSRVE